MDSGGSDAGLSGLLMVQLILSFSVFVSVFFFLFYVRTICLCIFSLSSLIPVDVIVPELVYY